MIKKLLFFLLFIGLTSNGTAGVTGKIAGTVVEQNTGEPLPGVNVVIDGTQLGASTDTDGFFAILNIPPDVYTVTISYIGYNNVQVTDVKVSVDLTTTINIELTPTTLELSETISVVAERPLIRKDEISTRHYVDSEEFNIRPVDSFQEVARQQAGVVGNHFRGGRVNEVTIMVDGIKIKDPSAIYSGNLGGFTSDVPEFGIQEMEVTLGGFSAEYGNVQSGMLNLALAEGRDKYSGRFRFTTNSFLDNTNVDRNSFHYLGTADTLNWSNKNTLLQNIYEINLNGPEPITMHLLPAIGVKIPGSMLLSLSAEVDDRQRGWYINQEGFDVSFQGKLTYRITPQHKLAIGGLWSDNEWDQFYYPASKYGPAPLYPVNDFRSIAGSSDTLEHIIYVNDPSQFRNSQGNVRAESGSWSGQPYNFVKTFYSAGMQEYLWDYRQNSDNIYMIWTHTLSSKTYYEVRLNSFYTNYHYATRDIDDRDGDGNTDEDLIWAPEDIDPTPGPRPIYREREDNYWWVRGDDPGYRDQSSWTYSIKTDLVSQISRNHLLKGGFELYWNRTEVENISWTLGYGIFRKDIWDLENLDFAAYIQDKLEFAGIIALVGLRLDVFNPNGSETVYYPENYADPFSEYDEDGLPILKNPQKPEQTIQWSPRIGISHPITERNLLHFAYGHYFQRPDGYFLYRNHQFLSLTKVGNYIGSPAILPEKTVSYEIGVEHLFTDDLKFTVTGYYKDINNLMNWQKYVARTLQNIELNVYTNADYGNIKGLEFTLRQRPGRFWGGSLNYTYSVAKGRSSSYTGGSGSFTSARHMNILDFDQTHTFNANIVLRTPTQFGTAWGSFHPFADWTASFQIAYGSGLPYSSFGTGLTNDQRKPSTSSVDFKLIRTILINDFGIDLFLDVFNLFNTDNVNFIGNTQYYDLGDATDPSVQGDASVVRRSGITNAFIRSPQAFSIGRQIRVGAAVRF
jgi:outer membrane receptor protein involved in Fe transport